MNKKRLDFLVIGFALLAMFFGAGNLIFPPLLGKNLGEAYGIGIIGFIITGVGLPLLGILASIRIDGNFELFGEEVGKRFTKIYAFVSFMLIGPLLAIPRTAVTTYELAIRPNFNNINPMIIILIYFGLNLIFVLKESSIVNLMGNFLTPILLIGLFTLIIKGIISPVGEVATGIIANPFSTSLMEGYQTMDAIASIIFSSLILGVAKEKGYLGKSIKNIVLKSSLVAVGGLALIYGGLTVLGAKTANLAEGANQSELLLFLSNNILGNLGTILMGICIGLACLTTSIGLISAGSKFFERITNGKLSYKVNVFIIIGMSIGVSSIGLDAIVALSAKLLGLVYPITIVLILMNLFYKYIPNKSSFKFTVYTALIFSVLMILGDYNLALKNILMKLPLYEVGFVWVTPAILVFLISNISGLWQRERKDNHRIELSQG